MSIDTPFRWIARSMEAAVIGSAPAWYAAPRRMGLDSHVIVEEPLGHGERVEVDVVVLSRDAVDAHQRAAELREVHPCVHDHLPGGNLARRHHRDGASGLRLVEVQGVSGHEQVEPQVEIRAPRRGLVGPVDRPRGDLQVGDHGPALLAEPGLVEAAHVLAVEQRRGAEDLVHRHHARAADAHHVKREAVGGHPEHRLGQ